MKIEFSYRRSIKTRDTFKIGGVVMRKGRNYQAMIRTNIDGTLADRSLKLENHGD